MSAPDLRPSALSTRRGSPALLAPCVSADGQSSTETGLQGGSPHALRHRYPPSNRMLCRLKYRPRTSPLLRGTPVPRSQTPLAQPVALSTPVLTLAYGAQPQAMY